MNRFGKMNFTWPSGLEAPGRGYGVIVKIVRRWQRFQVSFGSQAGAQEQDLGPSGALLQSFSDLRPATLGGHLLVADQGVAQVARVPGGSGLGAQGREDRSAVLHRLFKPGLQLHLGRRGVPVDTEDLRLEPAAREVRSHREVGIREAQLGLREATLDLEVVQIGVGSQVPNRSAQGFLSIEPGIEPLAGHGVDGRDQIPCLGPGPLRRKPGGVELPFVIKAAHRLPRAVLGLVEAAGGGSDDPGAQRRPDHLVHGGGERQVRFNVRSLRLRAVTREGYGRSDDQNERAPPPRLRKITVG